MRASMVLRSLRAAVFAVVCVTLAAAAHSLGCRQTPSLWVEGVGLAAVFGLGYLLGMRERSLKGIAGAMGVVQVGLHALFDATAPPAGPPAGGMPGMAMSAALHHPAMTMLSHHGESGRAITAHAAAALVASWWLRRGEAAVWSLLRQVAALVPGLVAWWRAAGASQRRPSDVRVRQRDARKGWARQLLLRHAVIRRGPPVPGPVAALPE
ncbi:hypothetical protein ACO0M4_30405 [Streptomyces sp. RGM 3693]|uniref:hypothetical protein n=1 Tax=Streptomyces sp. RGM 3693 TaxID=3413284 RepID=UPI003D2DCE2A